MLWKISLFKILARPIQSELFRENKRWRGLFSLPLATAFSVSFLQLIEANIRLFSPNFVLFSKFNYLEYGLLVRFVFDLSELPNSFIKRRLKIPLEDASSISYSTFSIVWTPPMKFYFCGIYLKVFSFWLQRVRALRPSFGRLAMRSIVRF